MPRFLLWIWLVAAAGTVRAETTLRLSEGDAVTRANGCVARSRSESSRALMDCDRTVRNVASETAVTARPTAIVVSRVTRLASERR